MPDLPGGGFTVLFVCAFGFALVVVFAVKELRFSLHYRRGMKLFNEGRHHAALQHLIQAERLWMLRLSKQTMASRAKDCNNLGMVLDLISDAAGHCSLDIDTSAYRKATIEMEQYYSNQQRSSKDYPKIYSNFTWFQKQFRTENNKILNRASHANHK